MPRLYVLAVGINEWENSRTLDPLQFAAKDATDIVDAIEKAGQPAFSEFKKHVLLNGAATRKAILDARSFLADATVEDQVVIFMSSHGVLDSDYHYRFCATDMNEDRLNETTLSYGEIESLFDDCPARRRIVLLDTCHSGEVDKDDPLLGKVIRTGSSLKPPALPQPSAATLSSPDARKISELLEQHFVDLRIGAGAAVLVSSAAVQQSFEDRDAGNGLFTAVLLQGITGRQADLDGDGTVRVSELARYCKDEVKAISEGTQGPEVRHINLYDDFTVVRFR